MVKTRPFIFGPEISPPEAPAADNGATAGTGSGPRVRRNRKNEWRVSAAFLFKSATKKRPK